MRRLTRLALVALAVTALGLTVPLPGHGARGTHPPVVDGHYWN